MCWQACLAERGTTSAATCPVGRDCEHVQWDTPVVRKVCTLVSRFVLALHLDLREAQRTEHQQQHRRDNESKNVQRQTEMRVADQYAAQCIDAVRQRIDSREH